CSNDGLSSDGILECSLITRAGPGALGVDVSPNASERSEADQRAGIRITRPIPLPAGIRVGDGREIQISRHDGQRVCDILRLTKTVAEEIPTRTQVLASQIVCSVYGRSAIHHEDPIQAHLDPISLSR